MSAYRRLEARRGDFGGWANNSDDLAAKLAAHFVLAATDSDMFHAVEQTSDFLAARTISSRHGDEIYAAMRAAGNPYAPEAGQ